MKRTLLDLTQSILSSLNSDEINSISDTSESLQVAEIIKTTYFNIVSRGNLPEQNELFKLVPSNDPSSPVLMYKPEEIRNINWIKYSSDNDYKYVTILPPEQFIDFCNNLNLSEADVYLFNFETNKNKFAFKYRSDRQPTYCTIIKDQYIIFDSYNKNVDSTLQSSKTICSGSRIPVFLMEDDFIPELDDIQTPLLLNEAKSLAFLELKQLTHPKAEQESKRQWSLLQKNKSVNESSDFDNLSDFGRRGRNGRTSYFKSRGWRV